MSDSPHITYCASCLQVDRRWPIEDADVYCGLCGQTLRDVEIVPQEVICDSADGAGHADVADRVDEADGADIAAAGTASAAGAAGTARAARDVGASTAALAAGLAAEQRASSALANGTYTLLVNPGQKSTAIRLVLRNTRDLPTVVRALDFQPTHLAEAEFKPVTLARGGQCTIEARIGVPHNASSANVAVTARGDFEDRRLMLQLRAAPPHLVALAEQDWKFNRGRTQKDEGSSDTMLQLQATSPLRYEGQTVRLQPWSDGKCWISVYACVPSGDASQRYRLTGGMPAIVPESVRCVVSEVEGVEGVEGVARSVPVGVTNRRAVKGGGADACESGHFEFHVPLADGELSATLEFEFLASNRPRARIPIRFVPGRDEWNCVEPAGAGASTGTRGSAAERRAATGALSGALPHQIAPMAARGVAGVAADDDSSGGAAATSTLALPRGINSLLTFTYRRGAARATQQPFQRFRLSVTATSGVADIYVEQWHNRILPGGTVPLELRFVLQMRPRVSLPYEIAVELHGFDEHGNGVPLSVPKRFLIHPHEPHDGKQVGKRHRLAIDFGTTNTCVVLLSMDGSHQPVQLPRLAAPRELGGRDPDLIPTKIRMLAGPSINEPRVIIGYPAIDAWHFIDAGAQLFAGFKPQIDEENAQRIPVFPGEATPIDSAVATAEPALVKMVDVTTAFLTRLLLETRAAIDNDAIQDVFVTFPATFSARQRRDLSDALTRAAQLAGVTGRAERVVDEANAGAFKDLVGKLETQTTHLTGGYRGVSTATARGGANVNDEPPQILHAMVFDIGGGTIDVALIRARLEAKNGPSIDEVVPIGGERVPSAAGPSDGAARDWLATAGSGRHKVAKRQSLAYRLQPVGVTGLSDFAGNRITAALARLLEKRLADALPPDHRDSNALNFVALPSLVRDDSDAARVNAAARTAEFLFELANEIKEQAYGMNAGELARTGGPDWYEQIAGDLIADALPKLRLGLLRHAPRQLIEIDPEPRYGDVDAAKWKQWLQAVTLTRQELDDQIAPALDEVFGRARRLWDSASDDLHELGSLEHQREGTANEWAMPGYGAPADLTRSSVSSIGSPDGAPAADLLFVLAGGSSCLPILWQKAQEHLGLAPENIVYDGERAKRNVAIGAATYVDRSGAERLQITLPRDMRRHVLLPICFREQASYYPIIFRAGTDVDDGGVVLEYPPTRTIELRVFESLDYRDELWEPSKYPELVELGLRAKGKELLTSFTLTFGDLHDTRVLHEIKLDDRGRYMRLQFRGVSKVESVEMPI